ncbi:MAG TPA: cell division protein ZapA [Xanthomonadaceae bacterium]|nr:cell division protein ZapA [Xanthomonadaceae bacterium]
MSDPVNVRILDRDFLIACEPERRARLLEAAALLDSRMREIRTASRSMTGMDRIAVMAALNIAHELIEARQNTDSLGSTVHDLLARLQGKLDGVLDTPNPD